MKVRMHLPQRQKYLFHLLYWGMAVGIALFIPLLLRRVGVAAHIDNGIIALGFDTERVVLLDYLLLTLIGSVLAAFLLQQRSAAWIGGFTYFVVRYLLPFAQQVQHPAQGPDGQAQILLAGAFVSVLLTLLALSLLCAGAGAIIGEACGQVLLIPLATMGRRGWAAMSKKPFLAKAPSMWASLFSFMVGVLLVSSFILSTLGIGPLLTYGPTTNLYHPAARSTILSVSRHGTLQQGIFPSPALGGRTRTYWIYLPPSYMTTFSQRYPTFYLLHGSPGSPQDWFQAAHAATTADALLEQGKIRETILIGVDGNGPLYRFSEWANSFDGRQRMEDAIVQDLVSFIDSHYRTYARATERAIGGLSMGGYGAVNIALHHPDIFHNVMSVGGYFQAEGPVFGTGPQSNVYRQLNSPSLFLQTPEGKQNGSRLTVVLGIGTTDGRYYHEGLALYKQLLAMKISVRLLTAVGGHSWTLWAKQFGESLPILESASSHSLRA